MVAMTVSVLISGALFRTPESKTSSSGKTYLRAALKVQSGTDTNAIDFWNLLIFDKAASAEIAEAVDGDRLAVAGSLKLDLYQGKISRTVFVDRVLTLRRKRKEKLRVSNAVAPVSSSGIGDSTPPFNDEIGF
jgi:hypothetical protein